VLVAWVLAVVLVGSVAPLRAWLSGGEVVAISGRFFALFTAPAAIALLVAMGLGSGSLGRRREWPAVAIGVVAAGAAWAAGWHELFAVGVVAAGGFAGAVALASLARATRSGRGVGGHVAHLGAVLLLAGIAGTTMGHSSTTTLAVGESVRVGGYLVRLDDVTATGSPGDTVVHAQAAVTVTRGGRSIAHLEPGLDVYPDRGTEVAVASLRSTPLDDIHVVLRNAGNGQALLVVHVTPLVQWVWWGGLMLALGGVIAARSLTASAPPRREDVEVVAEKVV
jgi:cytochrome c-type biogenesis protein CcmF